VVCGVVLRVESNRSVYTEWAHSVYTRLVLGVVEARQFTAELSESVFQHRDHHIQPTRVVLGDSHMEVKSPNGPSVQPRTIAPSMSGISRRIAHGSETGQANYNLEISERGRHPDADEPGMCRSPDRHGR
jgi:hypothetical protein